MLPIPLFILALSDTPRFPPLTKLMEALYSVEAHPFHLAFEFGDVSVEDLLVFRDEHLCEVLDMEDRADESAKMRKVEMQALTGWEGPLPIREWRAQAEDEAYARWAAKDVASQH